jgi:hypothetical protein
VSRALNELLANIKEFIALFHWLSNLATLATLFSANNITEGVILWFISGLVSGVLSEIIETHIPSYLRLIWRIISG